MDDETESISYSSEIASASSIYVSEEQEETLSHSQDQALVPIQIHKESHTNPFIIFINLTNVLLGPGIVAVSKTFDSSGIGPNVIMIIFAALITYLSCNVLIKFQMKSNVNSIIELAKKYFPGKFMQITVLILLIFFDLIMASSHLAIGADQIKSWLRLSGLKLHGFGNWALILIIYAVIISLLTIPKNQDFINKIQTITIFGIIFYAVSITYRGFTSDLIPAETAMGYRFSRSIFTSFGVHMFSFSLQIHLLHFIKKSQLNINLRETIVGTSLIFDFIIIFTPAIVGYLMYGSNIKSDVLLSYPDNDTLIIFVRIVIFLDVSMSYPVFILTITRLISEKLFSQPNPFKLIQKVRLTLIGIINIITFAFALGSNDFLPTLGLGGAISTCLIGVVFPFLCKIKKSSKGMRYYKNIFRLIFCFIFFAIFCISTYTSFCDLINSFKSSNRIHIE